MNDWTSRIIELEESGWSLTAIAEHIGLSPSAVSEIKQGRSKAPRGMAAVRLHGMEGLKPVQPSASDKVA